MYQRPGYCNGLNQIKNIQRFFLALKSLSIFETHCVRKTPPEFDLNRLISVFLQHNPLQINAFIFSKNLHNPEVPGSNPGLATKGDNSGSFCFIPFLFSL